MAREKKNVEQYFARMQRKLAAEADGPAPPEVEPTPAAEEPKAKKEARPSKRTSEVQKIIISRDLLREAGYQRKK